MSIPAGLRTIARLATRVDQAGGFSEELSFFDSGGSSIFGVTYVPAGGAHAGLVICCPILVEFMTNYRHEVFLARALAARGVAVQRFHYRGAGHSGGNEAEASLETMVEDAVAATRRLQARTGVTRLAFMGTRWGGLVAGLAGHSHSTSPLILWEPVLDPGRYFRELIRGRMVRELADPRFAGAAADAWSQELREKGRVDLLGYALHRALYESDRGWPDDGGWAAAGRAVLLVQFDRGTALRQDYARLKERVTTQGGAVDVRFIRDEPAWLWPGYRLRSARTLIGTTTEWLLSVTRKTHAAQ